MIWTGHTRTVATTADLAATLEEITIQTSTGLPMAVTVLPAGHEHLTPYDDDFPDCLEVGLGHPERAFVRWMGHDGGYGYQPDLPPGPAGLRFDYGGQPIHPEPHELRVSPPAARHAVEEFITTGQRPTHLLWQPAQ
ncbi:Immunity protein Imm1 [Micromonospora yangpuensis]|uniref:Immunity protein Imm1 n=2 Tax=Micromonospora yangpuensis TaxID=683228 RepID=A0A1C6UWE9_9ACTN|nr:Immunity protein Imm1 [Micromonospora yangpuensis]